jgi:GlpG protein
MRLIGHVASESNARTLGNYLFVQGIDNQLEFQKDEGWGVWIMEEDNLAKAAKVLEAFRANPADPKYQSEGKAADGLRAQKEKEEAAWRKRLSDRRNLFRPLVGYGVGPLSIVMIVACVVVFILMKFGENSQAVMGLFIAPYEIIGNYMEWHPGLVEVRHGEVWRLITPILIHFSVLHIFFNMLWLRDLGSMIEARQSSWHLLLLVIVVAALSNLAQFYVGRAPNFGGMSGVVYGLFGYIWIRGKYDPASGLFLHRSIVTMMLIWLVLCFTGILGPVANYAHLAGLLVGAAWGYLSSLRFR